MIYADFESFIEPIHTCEPKNCDSYTNKFQHHSACSYGYKAVCSNNEILINKGAYHFSGPNAIETFSQIFDKRSRLL